MFLLSLCMNRVHMSLDRVEMALLTQDKYFFVAFVTHVYL